MAKARWWVPGLGRYLLGHPADLVPVVVAAWGLRRREWWRHPPFLPLPGEAYWSFRLTTVNGSSATMSPHAVVAAARWTQRQRRGH